jgi:hypothetical protein
MSDGGSSFTIIGGREALADMVAWGRQLDHAVEAEADQVARKVAAQVAAKVPHLTGTLAASVEVLDSPDGADVSLGSGVPYAGWIEFGGSRGRPLVPEGRYLGPTAEEHAEEFYNAVEQTADDTARRFPWSTPNT